MEENKTLVDQLRHMVASTLGDWEYPTESKACEEVFGRTCGNVYDEREIFSIIANRIEREYLPRPRFEDGEPVQFGDMFYSDEHGSTYKATMFVIYADGSFRVNQAGCNACQYEPGERVKRPEPEVLDADGVPIHVGDTVWRIDEINGNSRIVKDFCKYGSVVTDYKGKIPVCVNPKNLTHKQPDSLERIDADAMKRIEDYWCCNEACCSDCPAKVDGKRPYERYETSNCVMAMFLDLLRRQREVLEGWQE